MAKENNFFIPNENKKIGILSLGDPPRLPEPLTAQIQWQQRGPGQCWSHKVTLGSSCQPCWPVPSVTRLSFGDRQSLFLGQEATAQMHFVELEALTGCFAAWSLHHLGGATRGFPCPVTNLGRASRAQWCPCLAQPGVLSFKRIFPFQGLCYK